MRKNILGLILVLALLGAAYFVYQHHQQGVQSAASSSSDIASFDPADDLGTYEYTCQDGTVFNAHFLDAQHLMLLPVSSAKDFPQTILSFSTTTSGTLYANTEASFYGHGETVQLTIAATSTTCSPEAVPNEAPMNFGD